MTIKGSIRKRLIISLVLLGIIPLSLLGIILSGQSFVIQQRQMIELQREKSLRILSQIESIIHEQELTLINALKVDHHIMEADREMQQRFLSVLLSSLDDNNVTIFNEIALLDNKGQEIARESQTAIITPGDLRNRSNADEFKTPASSRQPYYGTVHIDSSTGLPNMMMSLPVIDARSNNIKGVLTAEMRMKFMWAIVDKINAGRTGIVYITDSTGRVIVHPNPSVVLRGTYFNADRESSIGTGLDGTKVLLTHDMLPLGSQHLHVVTEMPLSEALRGTYVSLLTIAAFLVLTLASSIFLGFVIVRQIIRPVESLAETAKAISEGDINRRSDIARNDELGTLSDTFNIMTSRLTATIDSLKVEINEREKAEVKAILAYEEWQETFDSINQPVSIHDREYRVVRANKAFSDFFKKDLSDLIGRKCFEIYHRTNDPLPNCPHTLTLKTGNTCTEEIFEPVINKHLQVTTSPLFDEKGDITGSVHIAEDITERKTAELALKESHERLLLVLDSLDAIVYVADMKTYELLFLNKYARDTFGDIIGKVCWQSLQTGQTGPCAFCSNDKLLGPEGNPKGPYTWEFQNTINNRWYFIQDRAVQWVDGRIVRFEIATDITPWKEAEGSLIKERNLFRAMVEGLPGAFYIFSDKGKFLRWNRNFEEVSGYSSKEIPSLNALDLFVERDKALVAEKIEEVFLKGKSYVEAAVLTKDGREIPYLLTGCRYEIDDVPCLIGLGLDVSDRKEAEELIQESEKKYRALFDMAPYSVLLMDGETGEILEFNDKTHKHLGYTREEFKNIRIHDFEVFESEEEVRKHNNKILEQGHDIFETKHRRKNGEVRDVLVNCQAISQGNRNLVQGILIDITEQKNAENRIKASLKEKEVLLKEIHHRVKNNMQVVTSLLNLQADKVKDKKYAAMFNESRNRIRAMALVHEKLYRSRNLADIDFNDYITALTNNLFSFYGSTSRNVMLKTEASGVELSIDAATPCGLIINELVSNALKYAFPDNRKGELQIIFNKIDRDGETEYHLIVFDDGVGMPYEFDIETANTLGLQIVKNLAEHQLQGTLEIIKDNGTRFYIRFKEPAYKKRV